MSARPASRAIAVAPDGTVAAVAEHGYPLSTPQAGWSEQDPEDWWRATEVVLGTLGAEIGGARIAGIGLTGQMHGLVALDSADRVIRPAILWNDQRTGAECAEIEERIGLDRLISLTGNRALTGFTAPKLLWLRRHEPDSYDRIARIMLPKDYVRLRLTGEWATDVADASGTLLLDVAAARGRPTCSTPSSCRQPGCLPCSSRPRSPAHDRGDTLSKGSRSRPERATARPRPSGSGSTVPGRSRS